MIETMLFTDLAANLVRSTILERPSNFFTSQISASICSKMQNISINLVRNTIFGIAQHVHSNKKRAINWDNQIFLDFESQWRADMLLKELMNM